MKMLNKLIAYLLTIHWKLLLAKWMVRLGNFHHATDPGTWFAFFVGGFLWTMLFTVEVTEGLIFLPNPVFFFVVHGLFCVVFLYLLWEIVRGLKYLHKKAREYVLTSKARSY